MADVSLGYLFDLALSQPWALHEPTYMQMVEVLSKHAEGIRVDAAVLQDCAARRDARVAEAGREIPKHYTRRGSVGVIPITGVIARHASQVDGISGPSGTSVEQIRAGLRAALADDDVKSLVLAIDSPGGSVEGVADLADEIRDANKRKPITTHASGLMASAALWIGAQARKVYATRGTDVGSVGVIARLVDASRAMGNAGVDVRYVTTAPAKMVGAPNQGGIRQTDTDAVRDRLQVIHEQFVEQLAAGRRVSVDAARAWGDGRTHAAAKAVELGLLDGIRSEEAVFAALDRAGADDEKAAALRGGAPAANHPAARETTMDETKATHSASQPSSATLSFEQWAATNPEGARLALAKARDEALSQERARVAGVLKPGAMALKGVDGPIASIFHAVAEATAKPEATGADVLEAVMAAARELGAASVSPQPKAKAADGDVEDDDDRSPAQRARARASADATPDVEETEEEKPEPNAGAVVGSVGIATARSAFASASEPFRREWARMSSKARAAWGDEDAYVGHRMGETAGAFRDKVAQ